jgi:hypothetical protein
MRHGAPLEPAGRYLHLLLPEPMRSASVPLLALAVLSLAACSSTRPHVPTPEGRPLPDRYPRHTLAEVLAEIARADTLRGLTGQGTLALNSPQQSGQFSFGLGAARTGHFYVTISAFGIEGGRALVRPDSFFLHNRVENELIVGRSEDAGAVLPVPLTSVDGFRALVGTLRPDPAAGYTLSVNAGAAQYLVRSADGRRVFAVDPTVWRVVRAVRYDASGALAEEILMDRYDRSGGAWLPYRLSVRRPPYRFAATLLFETLRPTATPEIPDRLRVPSGTRRRTL